MRIQLSCKFTGIALLITAVSLLLPLGIPPKSATAASINHNLLIDDSIFSNTSSMTSTQIDAFLNTFPSSCISTKSGFQAIEPTGFSPSSGFSYGGYVSAGKVITAAANAYGLNPQVLVTTLEKEQSLVSGRNNFSGYCNNGDQHKYASAVGYGCPDSGTTHNYTNANLYRRNGVTVKKTGITCVNSVAAAGFSQQVIRASWLLRFGQQRSLGNSDWAVIKAGWDNSDDKSACYSGPMTQGYFKRCPFGEAAPFDGYYTIDGTSVHIESGATAALYWYTPHFAGNDNFVSIFSRYFGSPYGSLLRTVNSATLYLVTDDDKFPIPDMDTFRAMYPLGDVGYVSQAYLNSKTTKPTLKRLIKSPDSSTIYFFDAGIKLPFTSCNQVTDYGMTCSDVSTINATYINRFVNGPNMTNFYQTTDNVNYYVKSGSKKEVFDKQSLQAASITPGSYIRLNASAIKTIGLGSPVIRNNVIAQSSATGKKYFYDTSKFVYVPTDLSKSKAFSSLTTNTLLDDSINKYTVDKSFVGFMKDSSNKYVIDKEGKTKLTNPTAWTSNYTTLPDAFIASVPNSSQTVNSMFVKSPTSSTLYLVNSSSKHSVSSWPDFIALHADKSTQYAVLEATTVAALPNGSSATAPATLIKSADNATVYVVNGLFQKSPLSSFTISHDLGLAGVRTVDASSVAAYTTSGAANIFIKCGTKKYVANQGLLYEVTSSLSSTYGFGAETYQPWDDLACGNMRFSAQALPSFIKPSDGSTIYQVSSGVKRPIASFATYKTLGGNSSNTLTVSSYFASRVATGAVVN